MESLLELALERFSSPFPFCCSKKRKRKDRSCFKFKLRAGQLPPGMGPEVGVGGPPLTHRSRGLLWAFMPPWAGSRRWYVGLGFGWAEATWP